MARKLFLIAGLGLALLAAPALSADAPPKNTKPYPAEMRSSFMEGCTTSGAPEPNCQCILRLLERDWTEDEMLAFDRAVTANPDLEPSPFVVSVLKTCLADPNAKTVSPQFAS